jgi:undecaprenyl-diphosphatase
MLTTVYVPSDFSEETRVSTLQLVVLALVQGITEFLPISSQAHLIFTDKALAYLGIIAAAPTAQDELTLIVAMHVGTLGAVLVYFWRDVWRMASDTARFFVGKPGPGAVLTLHLAVATIPVVIAGGALKIYADWDLRGTVLIASATLGFAILLFVTDRLCMTVRRIEHMRLGGALFIGMAQVLAIIPGTSRSGITMTAARAMGYERTEAARFSMLLSIPAIVAAGTLEGLELRATGNVQLTTDVAFAAILAFFSALVAIGLLMRWLARSSFTPFVVYRVVLGGFLLWQFYG